MKTNKIQKLVEELLKKLLIKADVSIEEKEGRLVIQVTTVEDAPYLIGRYGETLASLQRVIEAMLYKDNPDSAKDVLLNVNDYREKQKERLEKIADNVALRVKEQQEESYLRSFSAYERKIIHEYISTHYPDLESRSEDEGFTRKLIIAPKAKSEEKPKKAKKKKVEEEDETIADLL